MRRIFTAVVILMVAVCGAWAEGYQVNTLSARQGGMAHTGVAQKLGAESMFFNPAGLAFMNRNVALTGSFNAVISRASATHEGTVYHTDNDAATPMMFNAAFSIYDNLKAGVSFYTPYGSSIKWGESWPGAVLSQQVNLKAFTVQPTVSWRIIPGLSVGAGLTLSWGNVDLYKGLVSSSTTDLMLKILMGLGQLPASTPLFGTTTPASINLKGSSRIAVGYNIGVMWDITKSLTVGAQFRSKSMLKVKAGSAAIQYANAVAQSLLEKELGVIDKANFAAEMPLPWVLTFGASYKPINPLLLALDVQLTGWSTYKTLDISFPDPAISKYDQHLTKDYRNSWAFRLGAQYSVTDRLDLRAGCILDLSPVNKEHYNPETPGMTKIEPSVGLTFRPLPALSIDLSFLYVAGLGANNRECTYPDLLAAKLNPLTGNKLPTTGTFRADYRVHAFVPSLGLSYAF